ncbi:serine/threonine protein kinase [Corallincola holothuriorum]|uniref:Stress response kinase A n=1 Tax=Corallincola holothuriorum TaxID=2282215 RepID=A0A368N4J6_9GAMM|nr:serine/threonine protein kinase [Corallincola holothuriorum]RCU45452.1 serine/threonine protein kinase [Corallincola holothuriorum]
MSQFHFAKLTPELILDALESQGIRVDSGLLPLNSYENRVYQFLDEERQRYVVKFYRPERWSDDAILEEHAFTQQLLDAEVPVVAPLTFAGKTLLKAEGYRFVVFPSVGGRHLEVDNLDQLEWVGRFVGRLHMVSSKQDFVHRPTLDFDSFGAQSAEYLQQANMLPDSLKTPFFTVLEHLLTALQRHLAEAAAYTPIRLHGDCHPGNILWRDEIGPQFVDLDDARMGPAVQDIWMLLSGERAERILQLELILEGYEQFCEFDNKQLALIEPLRALRQIHYMAWLARRWQDPAFPQAFPWFNSDKYWEGQILACKEQLSSLQEPPLSLQPWQ